MKKNKILDSVKKIAIYVKENGGENVISLFENETKKQKNKKAKELFGCDFLAFIATIEILIENEDILKKVSNANEGIS